ncbi:nuclear transport factor 2 family protein [Bradyrhizobium liaoningense]|uniref:nuclear transport factor 2 family protein n=1 Tax=Bradyrhizobium liaoningense TaxID=43992 RepID=UPI001BAA6572|nr:nuclear transport factor 2 family protein [Bradyrhizobium liaoningense]MBR0741179.1 nuclear transport factor 2 family protein [Bradyrhizobium liaoningense]
MSFDPMAAAVDWLDAYRACNLEAILEMYAENALVQCACDELTITGREALRAYWAARLRQRPAAELHDLRPLRAGTMISYISGDNVVKAVLRFNAAGKIQTESCGLLQRDSLRCA